MTRCLHPTTGDELHKRKIQALNAAMNEQGYVLLFNANISELGYELIEIDTGTIIFRLVSYDNLEKMLISIVDSL